MSTWAWISCWDSGPGGSAGSAGWWALCGLLLAAAWSGEDPLLAVLWLCWTYLWLLFFLQLALGFERLTPLIGWSLVLTSQASATVPAFMGLTGRWPGEPEIAAASGRVAAGAVAAGRRPRLARAAPNRRPPAAAPPPSNVRYPANSRSRVRTRFSTRISTSTPARKTTGTATSSPTAVSALPPMRDVKLLTTR